MKNIHVVPTDKPSRLSIYDNTLSFLKFEKFYKKLFEKGVQQPQNTYITNDEFIDNDWVLNTISGKVFFNNTKLDLALPVSKKIILTTDQDLIKDGVQAIPDEFLEWFVKNPSCEEVEIEKVLVTNSGLGYQEYAVLDSNFKVIEINTKMPQISYCLGKVTILDSYEYVANYKIIIPKEEPKHIPYTGKVWEPPKQETLKEGFDRIFDSIDYIEFDYASFEQGAKWNQKRSYSEEEVNSIFYAICKHSFFEDNVETVYIQDVKDEFKQFKKK